MTQDVLEHHRAAVERGALCQQCPLYNCGQGPVMGEVRPGSVLTVIGDAPSAYEVEEGKVFLSGAGEVLGGSLLDGGLARNQCTVTNAILCRPPGGDMVAYLAALKAQHKKLTATAKAQKKAAPPPLLTPQACCAPRLQRDIEETGSKTILAVGPEALRVSAHLLKLPYAGQKAPPGTPRVATLKKQHGSPVVAPDGRTLTASLHPNFGLHGSPTYLPIIREDIARAARIALRGGTIDWVEPDFIIKPSLGTCLNVIALLRESKQLVTIDIETDGINVTTAKIRCVGLGAVVDGKELIIVVPLRHMDGRPWWNPGDEQTLSNALMSLLESNPLSGHNLLFDTAVCLQQGLLRNRAKHWFDCYLDDETEFLTDRGWLKYDDVRASDRLATIASDNTLEWQHYQTRVDKRRKGPLLELETAHTRAVVTPGHTVWHQKTQRSGAPTSAWQLTPAEQLLKEPGGDAKVLRACRASADERDCVVTDEGIVTTEQAKFYGLAVGDGTIRFHAGRPYRLRVSQKVGGRAYTFLCDFTAFPLEERQYKKKETWRKTPYVESMWEVLGTTGELVAEKFHRWFGRYSVERRLPPWAFAAPPRVRQALLDGLLLGDASEVGKATLYRSFSKHLADDVQALALTLGIPATVNRSGKCWVVNLRLDLSEEVRVVTRESAQSANGFASWRPDGWYRVVCFVVPNHTLVTRSGGRPAFYGNTMLAHHDTNHSELPHDLGFVAARNFEAPRWKDDADQKSVHGVDDYWLHVYCAKDVLGEMRLVMPLARQVERDGTIGAFQTDTRLAPIARDMGVLGLNINETRRREFFNILDAKVTEKTAELRRVTGDPDFNPNAFKQVAKFLYLTKGLSPPYATDGREWKELADDDEVDIDTEDPETILAKAATNELSLLRLLELGVDAQTQQFIEAQLQYRGLQKCKATYVGLKYDIDKKTGERRHIIDVHRENGFLQTEEWMGHRLSIFHPSWKLHVTPTGRFATSPNVQNWPERIVYDIPAYRAAEKMRAEEVERFKKARTPEAGILNTRAMVEAPPGHILVGADYAAIELRIYAVQAQDHLLLDAILNGKDPHALNYAVMQSRRPEDLKKWYDRVMTSPPSVKKYLRIIAKRFGFLVIYGGQKDKLYKTMAADRNPDGTRSFPDLKPGDVEMWFDNWHRGHPETRRWHESVVRAWSMDGFVATVLDGRRRFFIGGLDPTAMPNMTIQGSAASIANRAMLGVAARCPHRGWSPLSGPVLQVHDFIGLQVPLERQKDAEDVLNEEMPYDVRGMPIIIEQKSGPSWDKT